MQSSHVEIEFAPSDSHFLVKVNSINHDRAILIIEDMWGEAKNVAIIKDVLESGLVYESKSFVLGDKIEGFIDTGQQYNDEEALVSFTMQYEVESNTLQIGETYVFIYPATYLSIKNTPVVKILNESFGASIKQLHAHYVQLLDLDTDNGDLKNIALFLAQSPLEDAHQYLEKVLLNENFINRLDTKAAYQKTYTQLDLYAVIDSLGSNPAVTAKDVLITLSQSPFFKQNTLRQQMLIYALATIRPLRPAVIEYWESIAIVDSPLLYHVVAAAINNAEAETLPLLLALYGNENIDIDEKLDWHRQLILPKRDDLAVLQLSAQMLKSNIQVAVKHGLVEVLFDYKPEHWYVGDPPMPPLKILSGSEAILKLSIANYALKMDGLEEHLKTKIVQEKQALALQIKDESL